MGDQASRPLAQSSQSPSGLVTPPANLQAMPTTAMGDADWDMVRSSWPCLLLSNDDLLEPLVMFIVTMMSEILCGTGGLENDHERGL